MSNTGANLQINTYAVLIKIIVLIIMINSSNSKLTFLSNATYAFSIHFMANTFDAKYAIWTSTNLVKKIPKVGLAGSSQFDISTLLPPADSLKAMEDYAVNKNKTIIAGIQNKTLCYVRISNTTGFCYNASIVNNIKAVSFLAESQIIVSFKDNHGYQFINLQSINVDKSTFNSGDLNYTINNFRLASSELKLYGLISDGGVIYFDLNSTSPTFRQIIITSIPRTIGAINLYSLSGSNIIVTDNQNWAITYSSQILNNSFQGDANIQSIAEFDKTLVYSVASGRIIQKQMVYNQQVTNYPFGFPYQFAFLQTSGNNTLLVGFIYGVNKIIKITITGQQFCLNLIPFCKVCDLRPDPGLCISCLYGYYLNASLNTCSVLSCLTGYQFSQDGNSCVKIICSDSLCNLCSSLNNCLQCSNTSSLMNGSCILKCVDQNCLTCSVNAQICQECSGQNYLLHNNECLYLLYPSLKQLQKITPILGKVLSFPSLKTMISPSKYLFCFLEDYWFYVYHDRNYSSQTLLIFQSIELVDSLKIKPNFANISSIQTIQSQINLKNILKTNYTSSTPSKFLDKQNKDIQFLINMQQIYTTGYLSIVLWHIVFRIVNFLLKIVFQHNSSSIIISIKHYFKIQTILKLLFITIVQSNFIAVSFYCFLRLLNPSAFVWYNKLEIILVYLFLFVILIYSLAFYLLCYEFLSEQEANIVLSKTKYEFQGYLCETIQKFLRFFVSGFIHAYLLESYDKQIACLIIVKILLAINTFIFRNSYQKQPLYILNLIYFIVAAIFDCTLWVNYHFSPNIEMKIEFIIIYLIGFITIAMIVYQIFAGLLQYLSKCFGAQDQLKKKEERIFKQVAPVQHNSKIIEQIEQSKSEYVQKKKSRKCIFFQRQQKQQKYQKQQQYQDQYKQQKQQKYQDQYKQQKQQKYQDQQKELGLKVKFRFRHKQESNNKNKQEIKKSKFYLNSTSINRDKTHQQTSQFHTNVKIQQKTTTNNNFKQNILSSQSIQNKIQRRNGQISQIQDKNGSINLNQDNHKLNDDYLESIYHNTNTNKPKQKQKQKNESFTERNLDNHKQFQKKSNFETTRSIKGPKSSSFSKHHLSIINLDSQNKVDDQIILN